MLPGFSGSVAQGWGNARCGIRAPASGPCSRYVGCVVDASGGLDSFSPHDIESLRQQVHARGAVLLRGLPRPWESDGDMDAAGAERHAAFLRNFGEPRAEYWSKGYAHWHPALPLGTLQKFSNDGEGVLLKGASDAHVERDQNAWHFDGEFNPWWTAHTSLFCEATPYRGHTTGYCSQRAAYLVALARCPELIARLRGMRTLCTIEGINMGGGNPGRVSLELSREVQLELAQQAEEEDDGDEEQPEPEPQEEQEHEDEGRQEGEHHKRKKEDSPMMSPDKYPAVNPTACTRPFARLPSHTIGAVVSNGSRCCARTTPRATSASPASSATSRSSHGTGRRGIS